VPKTIRIAICLYGISIVIPLAADHSVFTMALATPIVTF